MAIVSLQECTWFVPSLLTRQQVGLGLLLGPETEAELWYFGNMFVTESNDGYVVVGGVDGTMQQVVWA